MTERKPHGFSWEAWTERLIREGVERGDFDELTGSGRPIEGLEAPRDELWWVRRKLRAEEIDALPESLALLRDRQQLLGNLATFTREDDVRAVTEGLNERIRRLNRYGSSGPPSTLVPLDLEAVIERWRAAIHR